MQSRYGLTSIAAVVIALAPALVDAQAKLPRTPDGRPDLHGIWDFRTLTPLERPSEFAEKDVLTADEIAALEQRTAETRVDRAPRTGDPGTYNQFWFDFGTRVVDDKRTSLIVDPAERAAAADDRGRAAARVGTRRDVEAARRRTRGSADLGALPARLQFGAADHAERLQQQHPDHSDARPRGHPERDGPRCARGADHHARARRQPPMARRITRPLGGRHADRRDAGTSPPTAPARSACASRPRSACT